jgi:glutamyl-Q tRNA(Asp) synthetase
LQTCLGFATPAYGHLPVALNAQGEKLSKQTLATAVDAVAPAPALLAALRFLGQAPPDGLADTASVWAWALDNWRMEKVPRVAGLQASSAW